MKKTILGVVIAMFFACSEKEEFSKKNECNEKMNEW